MTLETQLAAQLIRLQPARAAAVLDHLPRAEAARVLGDVPAAEAAEVLGSMSPFGAVEVLEKLSTASAAGVFEALEQDVASRLARRLGEDRRRAVLACLPPRVAHRLETLVSFPEHTAGALMDPEVLALPEDLTVEEARAQVRERPDQARYNVYIVDRGQALVGVVTLRELLIAPAHQPLAEIMARNPVCLRFDADRSVVVSHSGWKRVHSLPVVDARGGYLGAVRYRTLRQLEEELIGSALADANATEALGEVFASGALGVLDALTGPAAKRRME
jgi:magnesium transporter